jgi:hypothetical protein
MARTITPNEPARRFDSRPFDHLDLRREPSLPTGSQAQPERDRSRPNARRTGSARPRDGVRNGVLGVCPSDREPRRGRHLIMGAVRDDWSEPVHRVRNRRPGRSLTVCVAVWCLLVGVAATAAARPPIVVAAGDIARPNSPCASQRQTARLIGHRVRRDEATSSTCWLSGR